MRSRRRRGARRAVLPLELRNAITPANTHQTSASRISTRTTRRRSARRISTTSRFIVRPPRARRDSTRDRRRGRRDRSSPRGTGPRGCARRGAGRVTQWPCSPRVRLIRAPSVAADARPGGDRRRARPGCPPGPSTASAPARSSTVTSIAAPCPAAALTSATVPWVTQRPRLRIATRSQVCWISESRWLDTNTVRPSPASVRSSSRTLRIPAGSRPFAGSSRISSAGSLSSAAASASRWRMPSEYLPARGRRPARRARPVSSTASTRRRPDAVDRAEQLEVVPPAHRGEQRRRLDDRADRADRLGQTVRAPARPSSRTDPPSGGPGRAGSGSSWSCPSRSARGTRTRRPRAPRGRARRSRRCCRCRRRYSLRSPSISITFAAMRRLPVVGVSPRQTTPGPDRVTRGRKFRRARPVSGS